jgi:hypothetical protein
VRYSAVADRARLGVNIEISPWDDESIIKRQRRRTGTETPWHFIFQDTQHDTRRLGPRGIHSPRNDQVLRVVNIGTCDAAEPLLWRYYKPGLAAICVIDTHPNITAQSVGDFVRKAALFIKRQLSVGNTARTALEARLKNARKVHEGD